MLVMDVINVTRVNSLPMELLVALVLLVLLPLLMDCPVASDVAVVMRQQVPRLVQFVVPTSIPLETVSARHVLPTPILKRVLVNAHSVLLAQSLTLMVIPNVLYALLVTTPLALPFVRHVLLVLSPTLTALLSVLCVCAVIKLTLEEPLVRSVALDNSPTMEDVLLVLRMNILPQVLAPALFVDQVIK